MSNKNRKEKPEEIHVTNPKSFTERAERDVIKTRQDTIKIYQFLHKILACFEVITAFVAMIFFLYCFFKFYSPTGEGSKILLSLGASFSSAGAFLYVGRKRKAYRLELDKSIDTLSKALKELNSKKPDTK